MTVTLENQQLTLGITGELPSAVGISQMSAAPVSPAGAAPKHADGWEGNTFYNNGKKYVVAISPEISKNGLHELRTYCYTGDNPHVPSEKITTTLLQPVKPVVRSRTTTPDIVTVNSDRKCLVCGRLITWGRKGVKYCSDTCQKTAYRQRKVAAGVVA